MNVSWSMLANEEFEELSEQGTLWEFYGSNVGVKGGLDGSCAQLVEGIAPLRAGQQAIACRASSFATQGK